MADPQNSGTNLTPLRGDPLATSAAWVTETTRRNQEAAMRRDGGGGQSFPGISASTIVLVQNNSGANRAQGEILGINGLVLANPTSTPTDPQTSSFFYNPVLAGITPQSSTPTSIGNLCICIDPIATGQSGRSCIMGICAAWVNMASANDPFADAKVGDATQLSSGKTGSVQILMNPSGATGKQICLVRVGNAGVAPGVLFYVALTSDGTGSLGTDSTNSSWKYYMKDINGVAVGPQSGGGASPAIGRENGTYAAAGVGQAYYNASNTPVLYKAWEISGTSHC